MTGGYVIDSADDFIYEAQDQGTDLVRIAIATAGGSYTLNGAALKFNQLASTRRMCAHAANTLEREVLGALKATTSYSIDGEQLMLLGGGRVQARFEATYLR